MGMKPMNALKAALAGLICALPWFATETQAMPSFARQTGMVCNSCHVGTDNVPNFTRTGRLFAMRGYTRPIIREKLRTEGQTADDTPQYGGDYLALNWTDFFSARLVSELAQGGKNTAGVKQDTTTAPLGRMALFYTGPITDWLGLWTEIGYLGNNQLNSVTTGNTGPTGLNLFAYDEYRLSTSRTIGDNSFIGMSFGNEPGDVVSQFVFPGATGIASFFSLGQGGVGRSKNMGALSFHAFLDDKYWLQVAAQSGHNNASWSDGWQQYYSFAYNAFRQTENDLWLSLELNRGNDSVSILTPIKSSFICPTTCPAGVVDSTLSFTNTLGNAAVVNAPLETVDKFTSYRLKAEHVVADKGPHSWVAAALASGIRQDYDSGAKADRDVAALYLRYYFKRTYGVETNYQKTYNYNYTTPAGLERKVKKTDSWRVTLLWTPAMNFNTHLTYNPKTFNWVFEDQSNLYQDSGNAWSLGFEYSF